MKTVADLASKFRGNDGEAIVNKTGYRTFRLTYSQLYEKVARTATLLDRLGIKKGDRIIVWGYNSPEWAIMFLAAASKGAVVVPADYMALPEHVKKINEVVAAKLVAHSEYKIVPEMKCRMVVLESLGKLMEGIRPSAMEYAV